MTAFIRSSVARENIKGVTHERTSEQNRREAG